LEKINMPLTTDDLRSVIHNHIVNECPIEVWEREYSARKHLTTSTIDKTRTPDMVMFSSQIKYIPGSKRPMYASVDEYKTEGITKRAYHKGKPDFKSIYRLSKKKDKATKNVVREFSSTLILMDHTIVVTTDPTDSHVISIDYVYKENEFLKAAQEKLKKQGLQYEH
jgi:hypothetical protein